MHNFITSYTASQDLEKNINGLFSSRSKPANIIANFTIGNLIFRRGINMYDYNLHGLNKARIRLGPDINLFISKASDNLIYGVATKNHFKALKYRTRMLELFLPRGGRIVYGLLGAIYKYKSDNLLTLVIFSCFN